MPKLVLRVSRVLLLVTLVAITYLSLTPSPPATPGGFDKANHLIAYATLAFLLVLSVSRPPNRLIRLAGLAICTIAYGIVMELIQRYTGRDLDAMDIVANTLGTAIGAAAGVFIRRTIAARFGSAER